MRNSYLLWDPSEKKSLSQIGDMQMAHKRAKDKSHTDMKGWDIWCDWDAKGNGPQGTQPGKKYLISEQFIARWFIRW